MSAGYSERRWTSRDGLELFARDYAPPGDETGLPVICLHGFTRNSADFEDLAPLIAGWGHRVIVPDVRGRGRSGYDPHPENYTPKVYARDVGEMMRTLGVGRAAFVGTSMGGLITMTFAAVRPRAVAAAALNDVGPEVAPEGIARILSYAGQPVEIRSWDDATAYVERINAVAFPDYGEQDWRKVAKRTFRDAADGPVLDYDPAIAVASSKPPPPWAPLLARYLFRRLTRGRPVLLIRGALSDILSTTIAERMQRMAPKMHRVDVSGVGHAPSLSEPQAVDAIRAFLRTVA